MHPKSRFQQAFQPAVEQAFAEQTSPLTGRPEALGSVALSYAPITRTDVFGYGTDTLGGVSYDVASPEGLPWHNLTDLPQVKKSGGSKQSPGGEYGAGGKGGKGGGKSGGGSGSGTTDKSTSKKGGWFA